MLGQGPAVALGVLKMANATFKGYGGAGYVHSGGGGCSSRRTSFPPDARIPKRDARLDNRLGC